MRRLLPLLALALVASAQPATGGRYLIICQDDYVPVVQPLAEWKTRKGMSAAVVPLRAFWARIAVRVAGSWVVAVGILMLGWLSYGMA